MRLRIMFFILFIAAANVVLGQDQIVKRNGDIIRGVVREIGTSEIRYVQEEINANVIFTIENKLVEKIIFADGKEYMIDNQKNSRETTERNSEDLFLIQRKNAIKMDFIAPIFNTTSITYERCLKPGASMEFTLGAVGLGLGSHEDHASGVLFKGGYKFIKSPDFYLRGLRYAHILKGRYAKMEFDFASYKSDDHYYYNWPDVTRKELTTNKWAIMLVLGSQSVFNDSFVIDTYAGVGIGKSNTAGMDSGMPHGFIAGNSDVPIAFSAGIRIGFLVDKRKEE